MLYNLRQQENRNPAEANRVTQSARQFMLSIQARERERKAIALKWMLTDIFWISSLIDSLSNTIMPLYWQAGFSIYPALEEERLGDKASWKSKR